MTDFDPVGIPDFSGTERQVGAIADADGVRHPTALSAAVQLKESAPFTIDGTATDITIEPGVNWLLLDLGTNDWSSTGYLYISGQYTSGGDLYPLNAFPAIPDLYMPTRMGVGSGHLDDGRNLITWLNGNGEFANEGSRILFIPVTGVLTVRLQGVVGTLAGVVARQIVGQLPYTIPVDRKGPLIQYASGGFPYTTTPYTAGDAIGTKVMPGTLAFLAGNMWQNSMAPLIRRFSLSDYDGTLTDFDVIFAEASSHTLVDNDPVDFDYAEGIFGWFEFRATPAAHQYPTRDFGASGGKGCVIQECRLQIPYVGGDDTDASIDYFECYLVDRTGVTFSGAGTAWATFSVEV